MKEIEARIIAILAADSTLTTLLQSNQSDNRIYWFNPPMKIEYSLTQKSALFYRLYIMQRPYRWSYPKQFGNASLYFRANSIDPDLPGSITERLIDIFDQKPFDSVNWSMKTVNFFSLNDGTPEGTPTEPVLVKNVSFSITNLFKRT